MSDDTKTSTPLGHHASSLRSGVPSKGSSRHWRRPQTLIELAEQANEVGTMVLNGEINLDVAAKYSAIVRSTAQLMSLEVATARLEKRRAELSLSAAVE